jgi:hypothetical protein
MGTTQIRRIEKTTGQPWQELMARERERVKAEKEGSGSDGSQEER